MSVKTFAPGVCERERMCVRGCWSLWVVCVCVCVFVCVRICVCVCLRGMNLGLFR